jgi:hypothetical protein
MSRCVRLACVVLVTTLPIACGGAKPATSAPAAAAAAPAATNPNAFTGTIAETMNSGGYTYARLQAAGKEDVWIAGNEFPAKPGDTLSVTLEMPMQNFESKTLQRTFPVIYFVATVSRDGQPAPAAAPGGLPMATAHGNAPAAPVTVEPVAPPPGGMSIAALWASRASLAGKPVTVRGKIVKVNTAIMDRNWIHLQDGSGSAADGTNDITITTDGEAKLGDVVTVTGVLATEKDFGAGYAYKAIVENAKLTLK